MLHPVVVVGHPETPRRESAILLHERCATHLAERVLASYHACRHEPAPAGSEPYSLDLTRRELDILRCIARGDTNPQIAHRLGLQKTTVKTRVTEILSKLAVSSRTEAATVAMAMGLVEDEG